MGKYTATITIEIESPDTDKASVRVTNDCTPETHGLLIGCIASGIKAIHGELKLVAKDQEKKVKELV